MTYPGQGGGGPWQPQQGPGDWQQPGHPQQPPYPQQPYPQQAYPQQPYQQPYPQQPTMPYPGTNPGLPPIQYPIGQVPPGPLGMPPRRRRSGLMVGIIVAVVVLAAGGVGTYFAVNHATATGSASPEAAATKLVADVSKSDVLGVVDDLPPAEAALFRDSITATTDQLKRLNIVKQDASPQNVLGVKIQASGITFDDSAAEHVNDHLTITKLVAGRITVGSGWSNDELTDSFLHAAFPNGVPASPTVTVDIAHEVQQLGHPIRIATVEVNGAWYPSLFYTIADAGLQAAHKNWPSSSIPGVGSDSADDAVRGLVQAAFNGDVMGVIERTDPNEMAALHDAGQAIVDGAGSPGSSGVQITSIGFQDKDVPGGTDAVVRSVSFTAGGDQGMISQSGSCITVQDITAGHSQKFCVSDIDKQIQAGPGIGHFPPSLLKLLNDMVGGLMQQGVGVVATQVDGQWYVSPGRTFMQFALSLYGSITPGDFAAVLQALPH